ncbi:chemotaxis protein CheW, partial [bacterium]|nr:chemotaxis protein CheW [bacterium]
MKLATFWIDQSLFAVDILLTREISPIHKITHVSKAPPYILGLINLRGQIITVVDPSHFLHNTPNLSTENCRFLIITSNEDLKHLKGMELIEDI